jgi:hypothetical protein
MTIVQSYCSLLLDVLGGFGVMILVINNGPVAMPTVLTAAVVGLLYAHFFPVRNPLHHLCNITFSLILTLSLCLNILQAVAVNSLSFLPLYVLLIIPRNTISSLSVTLSCLLTTLLLIYCLLPNYPQATNSRLNDITVFIHVFFAVGNDSSFYMADKSVDISNEKSSFARIIKAGIQILLLTRPTPLQNLFVDGNVSNKAVAVYYSILLLFQSMLAAASWFSRLRDVLIFANQRTLLRVQHIYFVLFIAMAWAFPWNMSDLRIFIIVIYTFTSIFMNKF